MARHKRKQLLVDWSLQGTLVLRALCYWACCLLMITIMLVVWRTITGPSRIWYQQLDDFWYHYGPAVVAAVLLAPMIIFDVLNLSNRFAGPLYRLRRELRLLAQGQAVRPLKFRDGDYLIEMAADFNTVAERLGHLVGVKPENPAATEPNADPDAAEPAEEALVSAQ